MRKIDRHLREFDNHSKYTKYVSNYYEKNIVDKGEVIATSNYMGFGGLVNDIPSFCNDYVQYNNMFSEENKENRLMHELFKSIYVKKDGKVLYDSIYMHTTVFCATINSGEWSFESASFVLIDEDNGILLPNSLNNYCEYIQDDSYRNCIIDIEAILSDAAEYVNIGKNIRMAIQMNYTVPSESSVIKFIPNICTFGNETYNYTYDDIINFATDDNSIASLVSYLFDELETSKAFPGSGPIRIYNQQKLGDIINISTNKSYYANPCIFIYVNGEFAPELIFCKDFEIEIPTEIFDPSSDWINSGSTYQIHANKIVDYVLDIINNLEEPIALETIDIVVLSEYTEDIYESTIEKMDIFENGEYVCTVNHGLNKVESMVPENSIEIEQGKEVEWKIYRLDKLNESDNATLKELRILNNENNIDIILRGTLSDIKNELTERGLIPNLIESFGYTESNAMKNMVQYVKIKFANTFAQEIPENTYISLASYCTNSSEPFVFLYTPALKYFDNKTMELIFVDNGLWPNAQITSIITGENTGIFGGYDCNAFDLYKNGELQHKQIILETTSICEQIGISIMIQDEYYGMSQLISFDSNYPNFIETNAAGIVIKFNDSFNLWYDSIYPGSNANRDNVKMILHIVTITESGGYDSGNNGAVSVNESDVVPEICFSNTTVSVLNNFEIVPALFPIVSLCDSEEHSHYDDVSPLAMRYKSTNGGPLASNYATFKQYMLLDENKGIYRYFVWKNYPTEIYANMFDDVSNLKYIEISDSVEEIGQFAFYYCLHLEEVVLPKNLRSINNYAFQDCYDLQNVKLPESLTHIGDGAFRNCNTLQNIKLPESLTHIGSYAFAQCRGLTSIVIPDSVTSIDSNAFNSCSSLQYIEVKNTVPPTLSNASTVFYYTNNCPIYVPKGYANTYKSNSYWSSYSSRIQER